MSSPIKVCVTGAAGQIAYSLLYSIAKGDVFGATTPISLNLLDIAPCVGVMEGVVMELQDCALPLLASVDAFCEEDKAFAGVDYALLVGAMPRREGMERKDLLAANVKIFKSQGANIDKFAKKTVKILVVGNPANTNAFICKKYAPSIPAENFSALTRLDQNRAQAQIAIKLGVSNEAVSNVIIWGNHSSTQFPDAAHARVVVDGGEEMSVPEALKDDAWIKGDFVKTVQVRGAAVIKARKLSSAMSAAKAICDHVRDWHFGTKPGKFVSMAVSSPGAYGIPEGTMYSFPVAISKDGRWTIDQGLKINDFAREKMDATLKELSQEAEDAVSVCQD